MFDFGREVGGFVMHTIGNILESTNFLALNIIGASVLMTNMNRNAYNPMRRFATPKQGGFVSKTVSKLPKQF